MNINLRFCLILISVLFLAILCFQVAKTELGSLILSELESSINPWEHDNKIGYLKDSKILQTLYHNGKLNVFNQSQ